MAKAPTPGVGDREAVVSDAQQVMQITLFGRRVSDPDAPPRSGELLELAPNLIPFDVRQQVRKQTGFPFSTFWSDNQIDVDSVQVLWWVARMMNGEPRLKFRKVLGQWPSNVTEDVFVLDVDDGTETPDDDELSPEG